MAFSSVGSSDYPIPQGARFGFNGRSDVRDNLKNEKIQGTPDMTQATIKADAEMPRFATDDGKGTNDAEAASKDPESGAPVSNPDRDIWVTEVALAQALNTAYFAENVATFAIWMGAALLLIGVGLLVTLLGLASRSKE